MLWYKTWLETRWRFAIGLMLLIGSAVVVVTTYPTVIKQLAGVAEPALADVGGPLGEQIRAGLEASRDYRGYVWWQWFRQNLRDTWTLFAVMIGTGGLLSQASGGAALFTLSMPVSRRRLLGVRAATGLAELGVLAIVPSLIVAALSPAIGETYSVVDTLVHVVCLFVVGAVFFGLAFFLSTVFSDVWRPALIAAAIFYALSFVEQITSGLSGRGVVAVMSGESYFRAGQIPWIGLLVSAAAALALIYGSFVNIERRDF